MTLYNAAVHPSLIKTPAGTEELWAVDKLIADLAAAGMVTRVVQQSTPAVGDQSKIWVNPSTGGTAPAVLQAWDGAAWTALTPALLAAHLGAVTLNSPAFTGTPTAPTQTAGDSTTKLATTEFVANAVKSTPPGIVAITSASVSYAYSVNTTITNLVQASNNVSGMTVNSGNVTVGAAAAGVYSVTLTVSAASASTDVLATITQAGSASKLRSATAGAQSTAQGGIASVTSFFNLMSGDTLTFRARQILNGGGSASLSATVDIVRLGGNI